MVEIYSPVIIYSPIVVILGKLILAWQRWKATGGFDYDAYYRWYRQRYPAEWRREVVQSVVLLLNPVNWWKAVGR